MAPAWNERKQRRQLWIWNQNHIQNLLQFGWSMIEEVDFYKDYGRGKMKTHFWEQLMLTGGN